MHTLLPTGFRRRRAAAGLSLVELLIVVMIIGVIGSLAMMMLSSGLTDKAQKQRDKRNAQTIASTAAIAAVAGADYFAAGDKEATVENLRVGCTPTSGPFKGRVFKLPAMSEEDLSGAMTYLKMNGTDLLYDSSGTP